MSEDISLWVDEGVIMLRVVDPHGDPVEFNEEEVLELISRLQELVEKPD